MSFKSLVKLENALFRNILSPKNKPLIFKNPINFEIKQDERWAIIGPGKTQFLKVLSSQYIAEHPLSLTYPFLDKSQWPSEVIQFLEFKGALPTAHLSARYEFFKDEFDQTTKDFVLGNSINNYHKNPIDYNHVQNIFESLKLNGLEDRWAMGLSNGQTRRSRLAKALIKKPRLLIIDDPFLGLDPKATELVSEVLKALPPNPYVVLGLRYQDELPEWITHLAIVDETGILHQGSVDNLTVHLESVRGDAHHWNKDRKSKIQKIDNIKRTFKTPPKETTPLLEFKNVSVSYRGVPILRDLSWKVLSGEKWHVRGDNGTGKSTLLSLITAEHPQSWNSSILMYGIPRRTGKQSFFDINETIGFSSPELHAIFPNNRTFYETITTGFVVNGFIPPLYLTEKQKERIEIYLKNFDVTEETRNTKFGRLSISDQKLALFIRAIIKNPDLLILDEALSVMEDTRIQQCQELLKHYPGAILAIGHLDSEVPTTDRYIRLIKPGEYEVGTK
ncbi:hypothetical protein WICMUC_002159 [Wickerhamomyces mucosus]|uniref:ABC transporter domain-containing protein n=1 Tax=Wickerhamomyces mucosus TaxID=1378264 RepID=A0A9P8PR88_9ASCO|nr:hypothetical protein WICMUC_002159 [Wickerhamomyces mucosus]